MLQMGLEVLTTGKGPQLYPPVTTSIAMKNGSLIGSSSKRAGHPEEGHAVLDEAPEQLYMQGGAPVRVHAFSW